MSIIVIGVLQRWTVGRVIDYIADCAGLHNPNNTGAAEVSLNANLLALHAVYGNVASFVWHYRLR